MKKRHLLLAIAAMLLPMSMVAQTYHFKTVDGLEYIHKEGDPEDGDHLFIWVGGSNFSDQVDGTTVGASRYFANGTLRSMWRQSFNPKSDKTKFYKSDLDGISTINSTWPGISDYKGVEYFRGLKSLTINSSTASENITLDLSENTALETLTFANKGIKDFATFNIDNTQIKTLDLSDCTNVTKLPSFDNTQVETLNISGCTGLSGRLTFNGSETGDPALPGNYEKNYPLISTKLKEINAEGCTNITQFRCWSSHLEKLNLKNCTKLTDVNISQGRMLSENFSLEGCDALKTIVAHRNKFEDMSFLYPANKTSLTSLQVNGGIYPYYKKKVTETDPDIILEKFEDTNMIREIAASDLPTDLQIFMARNNALTEFDASRLTNLRQIQINNNQLWAIDLSALEKIQPITLNKFDETPHTQFLKVGKIGSGPQRPIGNLRVIKGGQEDGSDDMLVLDITGHNNTNFVDENLVSESIKRTIGGTTTKLSDAAYRHVGDDKYFVFAHKSELPDNQDVNAFGKRGGLQYEYDTKAMSNAATASIYNDNFKPSAYDGKTDAQIGEALVELFKDARLMGVEVTTYPYIMYVKPRTKSGIKDNGDAIDYYSGTICLPYDSYLPEGLKAYIVPRNTEIQYKSFTEGQGNENIDAAIGLKEFADAGDLIPAGTAIYVRTVAPHKAGYYAFQNAVELVLKGWTWDFDAHGTAGDDHSIPLYDYVETPEVTAARDEMLEKIASYGGNLLQGVSGHLTEEGTIEGSPLTGLESRQVLTLGRQKMWGSNQIGFWPYSGTSIDLFRCYIHEDNLPAEAKKAIESGSAKGLTFYFTEEGFGDVTEIQTVDQKPVKNEKGWYTLQGVRLNSRPTQQGIYIYNGRKIGIK